MPKSTASITSATEVYRLKKRNQLVAYSSGPLFPQAIRGLPRQWFSQQDCTITSTMCMSFFYIRIYFNLLRQAKPLHKDNSATHQSLCGAVLAARDSWILDGGLGPSIPKHGCKRFHTHLCLVFSCFFAQTRSNWAEVKSDKSLMIHVSSFHVRLHNGCSKASWEWNATKRNQRGLLRFVQVLFLNHTNFVAFAQTANPRLHDSARRPSFSVQQPQGSVRGLNANRQFWTIAQIRKGGNRDKSIMSGWENFSGWSVHKSGFVWKLASSTCSDIEAFSLKGEANLAKVCKGNKVPSAISVVFYFACVKSWHIRQRASKCQEPWVLWLASSSLNEHQRSAAVAATWASTITACCAFGKII